MKRSADGNAEEQEKDEGRKEVTSKSYKPDSVKVIQPRDGRPIEHPNENDVYVSPLRLRTTRHNSTNSKPSLSGRGEKSKNHIGNERYRRILLDFPTEALRKGEKKLAYARVIARIRSQNPPGRFLVEKEGVWLERGNEEALRAVRKAIYYQKKKQGPPLVDAKKASPRLVATQSNVPPVEPGSGGQVKPENRNENDVLCGRGGNIYRYCGNKAYLVMVETLLTLVHHDHARGTTKRACMQLVDEIRSKKPSGRFFEELPNGYWREIGDARATKKVQEALAYQNRKRPPTNVATAHDAAISEWVNNLPPKAKEEIGHGELSPLKNANSSGPDSSGGAKELFSPSTARLVGVPETNSRQPHRSEAAHSACIMALPEPIVAVPARVESPALNNDDTAATGKLRFVLPLAMRKDHPQSDVSIGTNDCSFQSSFGVSIACQFQACSKTGSPTFGQSPENAMRATTEGDSPALQTTTTTNPKTKEKNDHSGPSGAKSAQDSVLSSARAAHVDTKLLEEVFAARQMCADLSDSEPITEHDACHAMSSQRLKLAVPAQVDYLSRGKSGATGPDVHSCVQPVHMHKDTQFGRSYIQVLPQFNDASEASSLTSADDFSALSSSVDSILDFLPSDSSMTDMLEMEGGEEVPASTPPPMGIADCASRPEQYQSDASVQTRELSKPKRILGCSAEDSLSDLSAWMSRTSIVKSYSSVESFPIGTASS